MKQTDSSDNSPVGVTNTHLDSKGYYFANGVNIIPGQNIPLDSITKEQAQNILKSEVINYINSEDLIALQKIANQPVFNVPAPTRIGQVLTSKVVDGKLEAVWDDLANVPQTSSPVSDPTPPNPSLFKTLQNMTYDDKTYEFTLSEGMHFAELNAGFNEFKFKIPKDTQAFSLKIGNMPVNVPPMGFEGLSVDLFKTPDGYNFTYNEERTPPQYLPQYLLDNAPSFDYDTVFTIYVEYDGKVQISTNNGKYFDSSTLYKMKEGDITSLSVMMPLLNDG